MDNLVISDMSKATDQSSEKVVKQERFALRHSSAAHILTNDDLEETDSSGSSGTSRDESP